MGAGRRRLLPVAVMGGMLVAGVATGTGSASADVGTICTHGGEQYRSTIDAIESAGSTSPCTRRGRPLTDAEFSALKEVRALVAYTAPTTTPPAGPVASSQPVVPPPTSTAPTTTTVPPTTTTAPPAVAVPPAVTAGAAPSAVGLPADDDAPLRVARGTYDPSLLTGPAPGVAPMLGLASGDPTSAVTTASQVQTMALSAPGGLGLPSVGGVVLLAGLGGVAVRARLRKATR